MKKTVALITLVIAIALALLCSCSSTKPSNEWTKKNVTVSLGISNLTLLSGEQYTFNPTFKNTDEYPALIWTSSDESVIEVTQSGIVMSKNQTQKSQSAKVTARLEDNPNMKSECTITVLSPYQAHFVTAGPGQNAQNQAVISWHSPSPASTIEYTEANGTEFTQSMTLDGERTKSDWADLFSIYRYKAVLENLEQGSTYRYRIKVTDTAFTEEGTFRTAPKDGTFSFAWLSDVHASSADSMANIKALLEYERQRTEIAFCLFTGDMVNQGKRYRYWEGWTDSGLLAEMEYAFVIGNHEYYPYNGPENATDSYYLDFVAIPDNHGESTLSDYWFLYDNVLFICLDTMAVETKGQEVLNKQIAWFRDVVNQNKGKYTYLIVAQHYAFLDGDVEGTGYYTSWYPVFDECKVDLALSSDTHAYTRSKTLFNNQVSDKGTIYMTSPMTEGKTLSEIVNDETQLGERAAFYTVKTVMGGAYITVTPQNLTVHVIGENGTEFDSVTIQAR